MSIYNSFTEYSISSNKSFGVIQANFTAYSLFANLYSPIIPKTPLSQVWGLFLLFFYIYFFIIYLFIFLFLFYDIKKISLISPRSLQTTVKTLFFLVTFAKKTSLNSH